ncbi:MAG: hypothetical protein SFY92_07745 [Verrucomicrobiae bacterium]|nr:hypothetical protein [Verrucomicrobiae bacterium]
MAYLHAPRWKAFVYSLPFPFTVAVFTAGGRIEDANILGLLVLLVYIHTVRILHHRFGWPIILSIIAAALTYCLLGAGLFRILPRTDFSFWTSAGLTLAIAATVLKIHPHREEPGHRTELPLHRKLPLILLVVACLISLKNNLGGFMTTFPMVGILGAYESRHSLWTMSRQFPRMILSMTVLMCLARSLAPDYGLPLGLAAGWIVCLPLLVWISFRSAR